MEDNTRAQHWNDVYTRKADTDVSWYEPEARVSRDLIAQCALPLDARILDVGGGASRLVDGLLQDGYSDVSVLDISAAALETTQRRLGEKASKVAWITSDITAFNPAAPYALWHDRAVFHFLTASADQRAYVEVLKRAVIAGGHVLIGTFALDGPERCSGLPVARYHAAGIGAVLGPAFTLVEARAHSHHTPSGNEQRFTFARFVRQSGNGS